MKTWMLAGVVLTIGVALAGCSGDEEAAEPAFAQGGSDAAVSGERSAASMPTTSSGTLPGITVVGTGSAKAVPDVAQWSFGVQADADTAAAALSQASDASNKILDAVRGAGIERKDIRTEQVSIYPRMTDDGRGIVGYTASSSISVTVRTLDKAGQIVDAAVAAGANQVSGPALSVSDTREQYRAAAAEALRDARARAAALAAEAGVGLGAPISIVESGGGYPGPVYDRALADAGAEVAIEPGVSEIGATLTVTFAIA